MLCLCMWEESVIRDPFVFKHRNNLFGRNILDIADSKVLRCV